AVPCGPDDDTDRGELVLGLDDRVTLLLGLGVAAVAVAMRGKGLGEGGGRGDRVPGSDGRPAKNATQRGRVVAVHKDALADLVYPFETQAARAVVRGECPVAPELQRVQIWLDQGVLAAELLADQLLDRRDIDVEQRRKRAEIDDVLEQ